LQGCASWGCIATLPVRYRMAGVTRFEREDTQKTTHLPESLGIATEGLRSTVELEVTKIVESAEARAATIEDQALEKASRIEQESEQGRDAAFERCRGRLDRLLAEIDAVETSLGSAVQSLRAEAVQLTGDLTGASAAPLPVEEEPEPEPEPEPPPSPDAAETENVRELIREQLASLATAGRTRSDAERMLLRFRQGDQYLDLLDEIYPEDTGERRGLLRRRKRSD